ncbi:hypothetical protein ACWCP6_36615 [Streptomyces sp. NPDC002004]
MPGVPAPRSVTPGVVGAPAAPVPRRGVRALGLLVATAALCAAPGPTALADDSPAWSVAPSAGAGSRPAEGGRPSFYVEGAPGTVLEDTVSVVNPGTRPLTVRLRGADADTTRTGALTVRRKAADTGAWIAFAGRTVRVPARTRADVPFTVSVPADAVPGDHPGVIVASADGRESGVRVALRVAGPTLSALTVEHVAVRGKHITYDLVNRGNTVLAPRLAVHADGVLGTLLDRRPHPLPVELLPGRRVTLSEPWPDAPPFDSVHVTLTAEAAGGAHATGTGAARFVPWGTVGAVTAVVALLGAGAGLGVRRRGRRRAVLPSGETPRADRELAAVATGEAP